MRTRPLLLLAVLSSAACGPVEGDFLVGYRTALCEHTLACGDQANLTFDGILTQGDCETFYTEAVQNWGAGCRFNGNTADQCLLDIQALTCPATEGELAPRPVSCEAVYTDCPIGSTDDNTDDGSDDGGSDTDTASAE